MANPRNIDIKRVSKPQATKSANPGLDIKRKPLKKPSQDKVASDNDPIKQPGRKPAHVSKVGYFAVLASAFRAIATADIFQFAFVRNLFSIRVLFFATLPIFVYQLRYVFVLKPNELLDGVKTSLGGSGTSTIVAVGLAILTLAIISWLADSLITPAIIRYRFQQLDHRQVLISRTLKESSSVVLHNVWQKAVKIIVFLLLITFMLLAGYFAYVLGYGSSQQQIVFYGLLSFVGIIIFALYFALRFWLQTITAVGDTGEQGTIGLAFKQLIKHPLTSLGYSMSWIFGLSFVMALSFSIVALVIYGLDNTRVVSLHIIFLAGSTTLLCILWSVWTAWQNGYWTKLVHSRSYEMRLVLSHEDQLRYWHFLVLIIVVLFIITSYVVLVFVLSDQLNALLHSISSKLPSSFELNLPKPQ